MERVTPDDVRKIMVDCPEDDSIVDVYILGANRFITRVFSTPPTLDEETLFELERWFTAHMIAVSLARTTVEEMVGDATIKYAGKWGDRLLSTPYGQMVLTLDTTGKIATMSGKKAASIIAVTSFSE